MYGREIIEQLPKLLAQQSEKARYSCAERMSNAFRLGVDADFPAGEELKVFEIYRKFDLRVSRSGQNSTEEELKESSSSLVSDLASAFQVIPQTALRNFVDLSWQVYKEERASLFAARSQASHVESVLKPFQKKYFDKFISALQSDDARQRYEGEVQALLEANCDEHLALRDWWDDTWNLFFELAVYKAETPAEKVNGMIGQGSVRTYRQQWRSWFKEHSMLLLHRGLHENVGAMRLSLRAPVGAEREDFSIARMAAPTPKETGEVSSITIEVEPDGADSVRLSRTWPRLDSSVENDILIWLEKAGPLLDAQGDNLHVRLLLNQGSDAMESNFNSMSAVDISKRSGKAIVAFISSL